MTAAIDARPGDRRSRRNCVILCRVDDLRTASDVELRNGRPCRTRTVFSDGLHPKCISAVFQVLVGNSNGPSDKLILKDDNCWLAGITAGQPNVVVSSPFYRVPSQFRRSVKRCPRRSKARWGSQNCERNRLAPEALHEPRPCMCHPAGFL